MPRLLKEGLDYFTLDCNFYDNKKIRLFRAEFPPEQRLSVAMVLVLLLSRIYSGKGYYVIWDEVEQSLFCEDVGISSEYCESIIEAALKHRIFDRGLYDGVGVLTSAETLKRYVTWLAWRRKPFIDKEIALMSEEAKNCLARKWAAKPDGSVDIPEKAKAFDYQEYRKSDHWQSVRKAALKRADYKCQLCGEKGKLEVHHNSYENLHQEKDSDVIALCHDCHEKFYKSGKKV